MAFEPSRLASFDRETLLAEINRVVRQLDDGRAPSHKEFNRFSESIRPRLSRSLAQFGTWQAAMRAAGVEYARSQIQTSDLEGDLKRVFEAAGGKYFTREFYAKGGGRYTATTLQPADSVWTLQPRQIRLRPYSLVIL